MPTCAASTPTECDHAVPCAVSRFLDFYHTCPRLYRPGAPPDPRRVGLMARSEVGRRPWRDPPEPAAPGRCPFGVTPRGTLRCSVWPRRLVAQDAALSRR